MLYQKLSELMKKKIGPAPPLVSLEREIMNFTMGQNQKKVKLTFWAERLSILFQIIPKDAEKQHLGGYVFSQKFINSEILEK